VDEALDKIRALLAAAASRGARIVCFPEAYVPGLRGLDFEVPDYTAADQERAVHAVSQWSRHHEIATVLGLELIGSAGRQVAACVIDAAGCVLGYQAKVQLDPSEDANYVPGTGRRMFEVDGLRFGIAICHEGWRYPETVRWAVRRGAKLVFHPQQHREQHERDRTDAVGRAGVTLLREGDDDAQHRERGLVRKRELRAAVSRIGDERDRSLGPMRRAPSVWDRRRADVRHRSRGSDGDVGDSVCAGALRGLTRSTAYTPSSRDSAPLPTDRPGRS
jgi:hypothetical protein